MSCWWLHTANRGKSCFIPMRSHAISSVTWTVMLLWLKGKSCWMERKVEVICMGRERWTGFIKWLCTSRKKRWCKSLILAYVYELPWAPDSRLMASGKHVLFSASFSRGQVLPAHTLLNTVDVELIYEGRKYVLKVSCTAWRTILLPPLVGNVRVLLWLNLCNTCHVSCM